MNQTNELFHESAKKPPYFPDFQCYQESRLEKPVFVARTMVRFCRAGIWYECLMWQEIVEGSLTIPPATPQTEVIRRLLKAAYLYMLFGQPGPDIEVDPGRQDSEEQRLNLGSPLHEPSILRHAELNMGSEHIYRCLQKLDIRTDWPGRPPRRALR